MRPTATLLALAVLPIAIVAHAGIVIDVPGTQPTIAAGLAAATPGDTVRVAADTYHENNLTMPSGVTLMSATWDPSTTIIDGDASVILICVGTTNAVVAGMGFQGGAASSGGAVYCENASVLFDFCEFNSNSALNDGGAIYWNGGTPEIYGCTFTGNICAGDGGALFLQLTDGSVTGCNFDDNEAVRGGGAATDLLNTTTYFAECSFYMNTATAVLEGGGGVWFGSQSAPEFAGCRFQDNEAHYGGGVYAGVKTQAEFLSCEFEDNEASVHGGAIYGYDDYTVLDACDFLLNSADGKGGAACFEKSDPMLLYCTFYENTAAAGGAIAGLDGSFVTLENCTIVDNSAVSKLTGGGIRLEGASTGDLETTIIAFNAMGGAVACDGTSAADLTCCDVYENTGGDWVDCIAGQEGMNFNIHADPRFCGMGYYDFYLCGNSPCLADNNDCMMLIGAWDWGCPDCDSPVEARSWGVIKALYR